jgi:hypothetical protein
MEKFLFLCFNAERFNNQAISNIGISQLQMSIYVQLLSDAHVNMFMSHLHITITENVTL